MRQRLLFAAMLAVATVPAIAQEAARDNIDALIEQHAKANKVPAAFVHRVVKRESNYNAHARGGSALGLMQIKHATARGMGYSGEASGLYDPATNLKYGIAYLAGAYRAAQGDLEQAYRYYNRGYYYVAKKLGIDTGVAEPDPAPAAQSASGFAGLFGPRVGTSTPVVTASADPNAALSYAAAPTTVSGSFEVPLPPRRPAALSGGDVLLATASGAGVPTAAAQIVATQSAASAVSATPAAATASAESFEVPLPPRRPSDTLLSTVARPTAVARRPAVAPVLEASAQPPAQ